MISASSLKKFVDTAEAKQRKKEVEKCLIDGSTIAQARRAQFFCVSPERIAKNGWASYTSFADETACLHGWKYLTTNYEKAGWVFYTENMLDDELAFVRNLYFRSSSSNGVFEQMMRERFAVYYDRHPADEFVIASAPELVRPGVTVSYSSGDVERKKDT